MKESLLNMYIFNYERLENVRINIKNGEPHGPFLMSPGLEYENSTKRILFIGRETYGWEICKNKDKLKDMMTTYNEFKLGNGYYSTPFWNLIRKIENKLTHAEYNSAWTNINRFDIDCASPFGEDEDLVSQLDDILYEEIKIIKPDYCFFFTSHYYDKRLKKIFNNMEFIKVTNFELKEFCKLKHSILPENSFRTYHPKYLRLSGLENKILEYL